MASLIRKRSVLFFSPCTPDTFGTGWEQRAYFQIRGYAGFMDVDVWFMPSADNPELGRLAALAAQARSVTAFYPCAFDDSNSGLRRRLMDHLAAADIVHICRQPQLALNIQHERVIWDIDELPWSAKRPAAASPLITSSPATPIDPVYARAAAKVRVVMASSPRECPPGAKQFVVLPNIVPIPAVADAGNEERERRLLFVGNLNYLPNVDALVYLRESLFPVLIETMPDVRITVVGRAPATDEARAAIDRLRDAPQFEFVFDVPDTGPYYRRSAVAIAPIRLGGGTRIKILEAFAHRVPVVSTAKGCEGLNVTHGVHLLIADDPRSFALHCVEAMDDAAVRASVTASGYAYIDAHHTQAAVDRVLSDTIPPLFPD